MRRFVYMGLAPTLMVVLTGCSVARPGAERVAVAPGQYEQVFDETRTVLSRAGFRLNRVDARAGIITTQPKSTHGLASPWDTEQASFRQEIEDLLNDQVRRVQVTFAPPSGSLGFSEPSTQSVPAPAPLDLREYDGPLVAHVQVFIDRRLLPGQRPQTESVRLGSATRDPEYAARLRGSSPYVPVSEDRALASSLGYRVQKRIADGSAQTSVDSRSR